MNRLYPTLARLGPALVLALVAPALFGTMALSLRAAPGPGGPKWSRLHSDESLAGHDAVLTPAGQQLLFGGEHELGVAPAALRQLDLTRPDGAWTTLATQGDGPIARLPDRGLPGSRAIIDPAENLLLAVCDCRDGNTFLLDVARGQWSHAPKDAALPLWFSLLAYDAPRDRAVLYGGQQYGLGDQVSSAGWAYDLSPARGGWQALPEAPFEIVFQAADLDPRSGHLVAFGGVAMDGTGIPEPTLWRLDLAAANTPGAWQDITALAGAGPPGRVGATLTFDPETSRAVLFGGLTADGDLGDVWVLDYADPSRPSWAPVKDPGPGPEPRSGHSAIWDPTSKHVVVYGGAALDDLTGEASYLGDTWAFKIGEPEAPPRPTIYLPVGFNGAALTDP